MAESWTKWNFSALEKYNDLIAAFGELNTRKHYSDVINFGQPAVIAEPAESPEKKECNIEEKVLLVLDSLERGNCFNQCELFDESNTILREIFSELQKRLSDVEFVNFCRALSELNDERLLNICFECVILKKLNEKGEVSLPTIHAITSLAKNKPDNLARIIIQLITNESSNFEDLELLEEVFASFKDCHKDEILMAFIEMENFKEKNFPLLQVMCQDITNKSFYEIVKFMNYKCVEFAESPAFGRLLVHICSSSQSAIHKDILLSVIDKNKTLFKKKALMNLSSLS
ncbi:UNVERIFIED_CONTAM: hypothetical protein PYX00_000658 [Menopon gallinae]|uniref:Uncharacterized protein n=1 Tax=Menopon gallinae TaxID=328185 RepID=A0AAW2IB93_9NEOP